MAPSRRAVSSRRRLVPAPAGAGGWLKSSRRISGVMARCECTRITCPRPAPAQRKRRVSVYDAASPSRPSPSRPSPRRPACMQGVFSKQSAAHACIRDACIRGVFSAPASRAQPAELRLQASGLWARLPKQSGGPLGPSQTGPVLCEDQPMSTARPGSPSPSLPPSLPLSLSPCMGGTSFSTARCSAEMSRLYRCRRRTCAASTRAGWLRAD